MKNTYRSNLVKLSKVSNEPVEFGAGKKGVLICELCDSYYFKKSWHNGGRAFLNKKENRGLLAKKTFCPADLMIKHGLWEGKVIIQNPPKAKLTEIKNLIRNFGKFSQSEDTLDRLIKVETAGNTLVVTTTENQMAQKLAKHIKNAFKKATLKISYQKSPGDAEVVIVKFD